MMLKFFHGWRRKAGCVALGLACCSLIGWFRSVAVRDEIGLGADQFISSENGYVSWTTIYRSRVYDSTWAKDVPQVPMHPGLKIRWEWSRLGLLFQERAVYRQGVRQRSISYWYLMLVPACQQLSSASQSDA
jgi:hypothetical protein